MDNSSKTKVLGIKVPTNKISDEDYKFILEESPKYNSTSDFLRKCISLARLYKNAEYTFEKILEEKELEENKINNTIEEKIDCKVESFKNKKKIEGQVLIF